MLKISRFTIEGRDNGCITDECHPHFSYALESDAKNVKIQAASLRIGDWIGDAKEQIRIPYDGPALPPYSEFDAELNVTLDNGESANAALHFETGRQDSPWEGQWISDPDYHFTEKHVSPKPMIFQRRITPRAAVKRARIYATALGIYDIYLDKERVGNRFFAPGFTSYRTNLMYQTYDVTKMLTGGQGTVLSVIVAGGWAVGSFVFTRVNRQAADRQALLLEVRIDYEDGTHEVIGSDPSFEVSEDGPVRMADLYDGETFEAGREPGDYHPAAVEKLRVHPGIVADSGDPVTTHERFDPVSVTDGPEESLIFDFGQNFAGVVELGIRGAAQGQEICVRHAEILNRDGSLNTSFLRSAKATIIYLCREGDQTFLPTLTYMGFRYIEVKVNGMSRDEIREKIHPVGVALYSDLHRTGDFSCSNELINRLQQNIVWSTKSNFVDIPTDCPQRDERMGWTGDINVFSPTAAFNYDCDRFLSKWLRDVKAEQLPTGGIPNTVPVNGYQFPATMPKMCIDWWGDACVNVPWQLYLSGGNRQILEEMYPVMTKYVKACSRWAKLFSFGRHRYIWNTPATLHFGDWVAPDVPKMQQWQQRAKWTATASIYVTASITAKAAGVLGKAEDEKFFQNLAEQTADAYGSILMDGHGKLSEEFQTGYVLPLHFGMLRGEAKQNALDHLVALIEKNDYCIGTGFPGTPYILFALADNGRADVAMKMLLNTKCPSWLYEVASGGTTIWERWDGLDENGECPIGDDGTGLMISYNHYASGAIGDFLYRRLAGLEKTAPAFQSFRIKPLITGDITGARARLETPYGVAESDWKIDGGQFTLHFTVPVGTTCEVVLPSGRSRVYGSGVYETTEPLKV